MLLSDAPVLAFAWGLFPRPTLNAVQHSATTLMASGVRTTGAEGREMPLKTFYLVLNADGAAYSSDTGASAAGPALSGLFVRRACDLYNFHKMKQTQNDVKSIAEALQTFSMSELSEFSTSVSLKWSETFHVYTKPDTPLGKVSAPHFKAKSNTKKLFIWNHSESSGMLLSTFH